MSLQLEDYVFDRFKIRDELLEWNIIEKMAKWIMNLIKQRLIDFIKLNVSQIMKHNIMA